jgi:hypothetical protein
VGKRCADIGYKDFLLSLDNSLASATTLAFAADVSRTVLWNHGQLSRCQDLRRQRQLRSRLACGFASSYVICAMLVQIKLRCVPMRYRKLTRPQALEEYLVYQIKLFEYLQCFGVELDIIDGKYKPESVTCREHEKIKQTKQEAKATTSNLEIIG